MQVLSVVVLVATLVGCAEEHCNVGEVQAGRYRVLPNKAVQQLALMTFDEAQWLLITTHRQIYLHKLRTQELQPRVELIEKSIQEVTDELNAYAEELALLTDQYDEVGWFGRACRSVLDWSAELWWRCKFEFLRWSSGSGAKKTSADLHEIASEKTTMTEEGLVQFTNLPEAASEETAVTEEVFAMSMGMLEHHRNYSEARHIQAKAALLRTEEDSSDSLSSDDSFYRLYLANWSDDNLELLLAQIAEQTYKE